MVPERFRIDSSALELPLSEKPAAIPMTNEQTPLLGSGRPDHGMPDSTPRPFASHPSRTPNATTNSPHRPSTRTPSWPTPTPTPLPQAIAHRGFKAVAPENTMRAFRAAVACGAHAIETDLHLTRDGVVVLCHDETLARCYGARAKVRDCDWADVAKLRTLRAPHEPMPRLVDLLEYLNSPGCEDIWVMLDVKTHDDPDEILRRTAETLASVPGKRPWSERITPCCWSAQYIKLAMKYLPGFHITHVGYSTTYARDLAAVPGIAFSILRYTLASPFGRCFIRDMKRLGIPVHVWTVNEEDWMEWSIRRGLDGVITDEPALFLDVCDRVGRGEKRRVSRFARRRVSGRSLWRKVRYALEITTFTFLLMMVMAISWLRHGSPRKYMRSALEE